MPDDTTTLLTAPASRRDFLRTGSLAALALGAAACTPAAADTKLPATDASAGHDSHGAPAAGATPANALSAADQMDAMHEAGIKAFPAKTEGAGNLLLEPRVEKGVKVYDLTASVIKWETEPGKRVEAWAFNGQVPGPQIRVREGDRVRVNLRNELPESTAIHFHGLELPNDQDGVPFITQPPVKPGASWSSPTPVDSPVSLP
jgi:FtsP/CotA-like multicopper oxidase with cupredoxin domain